MTQARNPGAGLEPLLPAWRHFVFEQQAEPFRVIEVARFGLVFEFLESLGHARETEGVQLFERGVREHADLLSMVVAGTAQIGVVEERGGTAVVGRRVVGLTGEKGGDALAIEDAEFDGAPTPPRGGPGRGRDTSAECHSASKAGPPHRCNQPFDIAP